MRPLHYYLLLNTQFKAVKTLYACSRPLIPSCPSQIPISHEASSALPLPSYLSISFSTTSKIIAKFMSTHWCIIEEEQSIREMLEGGYTMARSSRVGRASKQECGRHGEERRQKVS